MKKSDLIALLSITMIFCFHCGNEKKQKENYYQKGLEYASNGQFEEALVKFENALKEDSTLSQVKVNISIINNVKSNKLNKAAATYIFKGVLYGINKRIGEKISSLKKSLEISPDFALAHNELGIAYFANQEYNLAVESYSKAIQIQPELTDAYYNKAIACEQIKDYKQALDAYKNYLKTAPKADKRYIEYASQRMNALENQN